MGKKRVQQLSQVRQPRQQLRQIKPKSVPAPAAGGNQKKQRERYVKAGGLLQGYAPELVLRIGYAAGVLVVVCLVAMLLALLLLPYGWPVRAVAALPWVFPIGFVISFVLPGFRLARKDRHAESKLVQGQLLGTSPVSTSIGLGMLMVKTRGGTEQFLVEPEKLTRVPGNQVNVMLNVTPHLRHVRSVGVVGPRLMARPDQPVPPVLRRLRVLPILTPAALSVATIVGADAVAGSPIQPELLHAVLAAAVAAALGGAVYGVFWFYQRRVYKEVQSLMPGGI